MATFWPSTKPITFRPSRNAATRWADGAAEALLMNPMTGIAASLRASRERPRSRRTSEQRDELAPSHAGHGAYPSQAV